ncbi:unnamed protein product [Meganyctiphanes norvegica]|uniref:Broad-complex n=1 Tax=Meganyctiphanes norvegica TaxID=48144 RepID=A0AAV2Q0V6_MEGNR
MEDGLLSLKWNNHKTTFFEILRILREKSNYTDATLAVEGKFYPVHKLVMSTCSEYFSDIFEKTPCKSPVIVLKDVRSHDIEALLDYMYLGEVNVNQNDLSSLLKTAECLRIKGLAVPDEDPTKVRKNSTSSHDDTRRDSPPPKRRRHHSITDTIPPRAASPVPSPPKSATALVKPAQTTPIPPHSITPHSTPNTSNTEQDEPTVVKVEMDDNEEQEDRFRRENNYEGSASNDRDTGGDYGPDLSKAEHEPENYGNASFPGSSLQQSGEVHWDEGDSSSFPPESYSGEVPSSQQAQGGWGSVRAGALIPLVELGQPVPASITPSSTTDHHQHAVAAAKLKSMVEERSIFAPYSLSSVVCGGGTPDHGQVAPADRQAFVCPVCGKQFGQPYNLRRHLTTHTGERPYQCPHCNYAASQNVHLEKHIRRIHMTNNNIAGTIPQIHQPSTTTTSWITETTAITP